MEAQIEQRRLTSILAADVVGYSRLMGADEAGTLAALKAHRKELIDPKTDQHNGRLVNTAGDGALMEFSSVVEAVRFAVEVQAEMLERTNAVSEDRRIQFRIGINIGDIIVDGDDIYGEAVNIAARLESVADAGGICVSGKVYDEVKDKLDLRWVVLGQQQLKNIRELVRIYSVGFGHAGQASGSSHEALLDRPAVAVLPFVNISGDPNQEYFADGLSEDIITALCRWREFPVIARNSTCSYKGKSSDFMEVAKKLNARYLVEGSVRKSGDRVRISTQLIDAKTGQHIWADRYDRTVDDIFALQDEITYQISATIVPELEHAEHERAARFKPSLSAWDLFQQGMACKAKLTKEATIRARTIFEQAIILDPKFAQPHTWLAWVYQDDHDEFFISPPEIALTNWLSEARRAIALDYTDAWAHVALGLGLTRQEDYDQAIAELETAIELNPSHSFAYTILGGTLAKLNSVEDGIPLIERGLRLNPRDPQRGFISLGILARAHLDARRYQKAVDWALKSIQLRADDPRARITLTSSLGHLGRSKEASDSLKTCERVRPGCLEQFLGSHSFISSPHHEHFLEGLRKAGWKH